MTKPDPESQKLRQGAFRQSRGAMGKLFGVMLTIIALASVYPIVTHMYVQPVDISTHGHAIDEQFADPWRKPGCPLEPALARMAAHRPQASTTLSLCYYTKN